MVYIISGTATFSSQANRDAARTRLDSALLSYSLTSYATTFTAGIAQPTTTTMTVSFSFDGDHTSVSNAAKAIYDAWIGTGGTARHTLGFLSVSKV
jgi:hypothetical protein